jgi:hypothetical protein
MGLDFEEGSTPGEMRHITITPFISIKRFSKNVRPAGCLRETLPSTRGCLYWTLVTLLPGFKQFRFLSKLLIFTVLGLAVIPWTEKEDFQDPHSCALSRGIWLAGRPKLSTRLETLAAARAT